MTLNVSPNCVMGSNGDASSGQLSVPSLDGPEPSPQSIVAVKSDAVASGSAAVNVATTTGPESTPWAALMLVPVADSGPSVAATRAAMTPVPPSGVVIVTVAV